MGFNHCFITLKYLRMCSVKKIKLKLINMNFKLMHCTVFIQGLGLWVQDTSDHLFLGTSRLENQKSGSTGA